MECRTKRLLIRDFVEADRVAVRAWRTDPEVMRYLDQPLGSDPDGWFDAVLRFAQHQPRNAHDAAITLRATGEVIGWIGIGRSMDPGAGDLVVGYALARAWWGKGYMSEALVGVLAFGFAEFGVETISAQCYVANPASARVMEKAGMKREGRAISANPSLGESLRCVARRDEWRHPGRRRFGLVITIGLVVLLAVPAALGQLLDLGPRPGPPDDHRLLPWAPRGDLVDDRDFLRDAERVWQEAAAVTDAGQLDQVCPVWAGTIGSGRVAVLQAVAPDGLAYVAQVSERGRPAVLRLDLQERLPTTKSLALAVNYDGNVDVPLLRPARGAALLRLVVAPSVAAAARSAGVAEPAEPAGSAAGGAGTGPSGEVGAGRRTSPTAGLRAATARASLWRRVREFPSAADSDWDGLPVGASGLTETWLHLASRSPDGSVVLLARPNAGDEASVATLAARPDHLVLRRPQLRLVDPSWGPLTPLDLPAYDDARAAQAVLGPPVIGTDFALMAVTGDNASDRVSLLEARPPGGGHRVVLLTWEARRLACLADHAFPRLSDRALVAVACVDPLSGDVTVAAAARAGVARIRVRDAAGTVVLATDGRANGVAHLPAGAAPAAPMVASAFDRRGVGVDQVTVRVTGTTPPPR